MGGCFLLPLFLDMLIQKLLDQTPDGNGSPR